MPNLNPAMLVMQALGAGQPLNNILGNLAGQGAQYAKAVMTGARIDTPSMTAAVSLIMTSTTATASATTTVSTA